MVGSTCWPEHEQDGRPGILLVVNTIPTLRELREEDYDSLVGQLNDWWGGREVRSLVPRLFFQHFLPLSTLAVGATGAPVAFLVGFISQTDPAVAYVHFVGVHPAARRSGLGRRLYERFFEQARERGAQVVHAVTSPANHGSIAFHTRMGFVAKPGPAEANGVPYHPDYDGPGDDRVTFQRALQVAMPGERTDSQASSRTARHAGLSR
jgi:ribosomal protein S18 acetylase RimI-like enzyme